MVEMHRPLVYRFGSPTPFPAILVSPSPSPPDTPAARSQHTQLAPLPRLLRRTITGVVGTVFEGAARLGARLPMANPTRFGVTVERNIAYDRSGEESHLLDVYRPVSPRGPAPVVLYIHGGGFRILSKDTHWVMAIEFARRGYVVFSINYRLAPRNPYPAAAIDTCKAWQWVVQQAEQYGGDPSRMVVAGESAGANLSTMLAVATCYPRPEPWAQAVFDLGVVPRVVVPANGILQVSDPRRFARSGASTRLSQPVIDSCFANYICGHPGADVTRVPAQTDGYGLADPLCILEECTPARPLPAFYISCGTADPIVEDSTRLAAAVQAHGGRARCSLFEGMGHSFHAWVLHPAARRCWAETHAFLDTHLSHRSDAAEVPR